MTEAHYIRKVAAQERGRVALEDLCGEPDDSLESIRLSKLAHVEDPELYRIALSMGGDPLGNYETLGGTFRKQASGRLENSTVGANVGVNVGILGSLLGGAAVGAKNKGIFNNTGSRLGGALEGLAVGALAAPVAAVAGAVAGAVVGALLPVGKAKEASVEKSAAKGMIGKFVDSVSGKTRDRAMSHMGVAAENLRKAQVAEQVQRDAFRAHAISAVKQGLKPLPGTKGGYMRGAPVRTASELNDALDEFHRVSGVNRKAHSAATKKVQVAKARNENAISMSDRAIGNMDNARIATGAATLGLGALGVGAHSLLKKKPGAVDSPFAGMSEAEVRQLAYKSVINDAYSQGEVVGAEPGEVSPFRKTAFGTPMFQAPAAVPAPPMQMGGAPGSAGPKGPTGAGSSGGMSSPKAPGAGGGNSTPSTPSITGSTGQSAGGQ